MSKDVIFKDWDRLIDYPVLHSVLSTIDKRCTNICPGKKDVFKAFTLCPLKNCKVIFIGQDPYPQQGVATGLSFGNSVDTPEEEISPSLKVLKEAAIDYTKFHNMPITFDNSLESWAKQGVLLLNSALTCEVNKVGTHTMLWRPFIISLLNNIRKYTDGLVFVLLGQTAKTFISYIDTNRNLVLQYSHPSFYSRENKSMPPQLFTDINKYLKEQYNTTIEWYEEYK